MTSSPGQCLASEHDRSSYFYPFFVSTAVLLWMVVTKYDLIYHTALWWEYLTTSVPTLEVEMTAAESSDDGLSGEPCEDMSLLDPSDPSMLQCFDPSTRQKLGTVANMSASEVHDILAKAQIAQHEWRKTTFAQRRLVLRTIQKYVCHHVDDICRVSARDSGKPKVDAVLGEILTTCEKIRTICHHGEQWLRPDYRPVGPMMVYKTAMVEYVPLGVIAAVAPWNYPFHNSVS